MSIQYSEDGLNLLSCPKEIEGDIIVKPGVKIISAKAFSFCKGINSVTLPDSVIEIKKEAFAWCTNLKKIKLSKNLTSIGDLAFEYTGLSSLKIPASVKKIGFAVCKGCDRLKIVKNKRFLVYYNPKKEYDFIHRPRRKYVDIIQRHIEILPSGYEEICSGACDGIKFGDLEIPSGVKVIHKRAFYNCHMEFLTFPESLTTIKTEAFFSSDPFVESIPSKLKNVGEIPFDEFPFWPDESNVQNDYVILHIPTMTTGMFKTPSKVKIIGEEAFAKSNITAIFVSDSVRSIRKKAFSGCSSLKDIRLSTKIRRITEAMFRECTNIEDIIIPEGVEYIENEAFRSCKSLKTITLPTTLKEIGDNAFQACESLRTISIPRSCTKLGNFAFADCTNLVEINLPMTLKNIGTYAFSGCSKLAGQRDRYV